MNKEWIIQSVEEEKVNELHEALGIDRMFCELLVQRGIYTFEAAKVFFRPDVAHLHEPFLMKDMDAAVLRLDSAIQKNERVLIYGDYDVDGTTSVAMMYRFLSQHHESLDYYIPDRYSEGYGISMQGIDYAQQNGFSLIIAIDCGINAIAQVEKATSYGIDFIICDHHLPKEILPKAVAVLDPKRSDCDYPFKELSGCGVAFKLIQGFIQYKKLPSSSLNELLDLLVVSIACDIVPVIGENRTLAHFGLKMLNARPSSGLRALIDANKRNYPLSISDIVFGIGPSINAAGRLADAKLAVRMLLATDKKVALHLAQELKHKNEKRKDFEYEITQAAIYQFTHQANWEDLTSIVVFGKDWHKGVIGIVASKLVDKFQRPAIVLTASNGKIVGSARSVSGYDVHQAIQHCEQYLINFGGHRYAAGLTMAEEQFSNFKANFEKYVHETITKKQLTPSQHIDNTLRLEQITPKFLRILHQFAPFGPHNRRPIFVSRGVQTKGKSRVLKELHLKFSVKQEESARFDCIGFGMAYAKDYTDEINFDICYVIEESTWKGKKRKQLRIKDIKAGKNNKLM